MSGWNSWDADSVWERRAAIKAQDLRFCRAMRRAHPELATSSAPRRLSGRKARDGARAAASREDSAFGWQGIVAEVGNKHGVTLAEMCGERRGRPLVMARHEAMYRLKVETRMSLPAIGERLGRDHSSVICGIARHRARLTAK